MLTIVAMTVTHVYNLFLRLKTTVYWDEQTIFICGIFSFASVWEFFSQLYIYNSNIHST